MICMPFYSPTLPKRGGNNEKIAGIKDIHSMKPAREMIKLAMSYAK